MDFEGNALGDTVVSQLREGPREAASQLTRSRVVEVLIEEETIGFTNGAIPLEGANPHAAFVVASDGSGDVDGGGRDLQSGEGRWTTRHGERERRFAERYRGATGAAAYDGARRSEVKSAWQGVRDRPWVFPPPPASDSDWSFSRRIASYDPTAQWRRVSIPVLLVYGENDEQVPPRQGAARIAEAYLGSLGSRLDVVFFPGVDHTFRLPRSGPAKFEWRKRMPG